MATSRAQVRYVDIDSNDAGMRLDNYLLRVFKDVPKSRIYKIIRSGEVRINSGRAKPSTRLSETDQIRLPPVSQRQRKGPGRPPDELMARVEAACIEQHEDYLVFDKPAGLAVHAGSGLRFGLIEVLKAARPDEYVELVHRLDRQTSGCLLVARSKPALDGLRLALNDAAAGKTYLALLEGRWEHGKMTIDAPLSRDQERAGERVVTVDHVGGRPSCSVFEPLSFFADATLMRVRIHTGRTHQIRVHAAHVGHAVAADDKYGPNERAALWRERGLRRMFLHAGFLEIRYQDRELAFEAPLPDDLEDVLRRLEPLS